MSRIKGPHWTLAAGAVLAAVLLALDVRATPSHGVAQTAAATPYPPGASTSAGVPQSTSSPPTTPATQSTAQTTSRPADNVSTLTVNAPNPDVADYAGRVDGGGASLAVSIYHGRAIAYVCGGSFEVWFTGKADAGKLTLTSRYGATLTASFDGANAHGQVTGAGRHWTFTAPTVKSPSGLYRAYAKDRKIQATWIVLPDGSQIGAADAGGDTATASPVGALDLGTLTGALPDGQQVTAARIDGTVGAS